MQILIGTAGWSLPRAEQEHFPGDGSHLERYAARFGAVEINSTFHRSHRAATWLRWRAAVPEQFRFSVKIPKTITHTRQLRDCDDLIAPFLEEAGALGSKLSCLLVQLPPKLNFDPAVAASFFEKLRARTTVAVACEPRHASWFGPDADQLLERYDVARVAADPARVPLAAAPGGWRGFTYYRLHGSPRIYYSAYSAEFLASLAARIQNDQSVPRDVWVIFDNTTLGAATGNALDLLRALG
jgi:uncharacterized protein YecE (DUF72 family)